eukprot:TRINITY_DN15569_c0_g2_i1.p1 TRINITY_DN15569_c0_g2~~TRINITY_DN15569_c0_g2_i1.p1  ORF type:complete len:418 (-),score=53.07 TRINITY_DN15569_c0_g2_i1:589-1842(-)
MSARIQKRPASQNDLGSRAVAAKRSKPERHAAKPSSNTRALELTLGDVDYLCTCTRDPAVAESWARRVLKDVNSMPVTSNHPRSFIGLDCEWSAPWHRPGQIDRLATLQLFYKGKTDVFALVFQVNGLDGKLPSGLEQLLSDETIVKVGANIMGDASRLVRDFGCILRGFFELSNLVSSGPARLRKAKSLEDIVNAVCPTAVHVNKRNVVEKSVRTSDWEAWPLSDEQVRCAAGDAGLSVIVCVTKLGISTGSAELHRDALTIFSPLKSFAPNIVGFGEGKEDETSSGMQLVLPSATTAKKKPASTNPNKPNFFQFMRNTNILPPNLGKKVHPEGSSTALADVCIIVSGVLDSFERADMEKYVIRHGGKVSKSVGPKVTHLVNDHGEVGPAKLAKFKTLGIPVVSEDDILRLVNESK